MGMTDETLQSLVDSRGLSLGELAKAAGISSQCLRMLRIGTVGAARTTTVAKLAKALGVDPSRVRAAIEASWAAKA